MYVCEASALSISWICFCFSLESSRIDWTCALCDGFPVHCGSIGTVPGPHRIRGVLSWCPVGGVSRPSAETAVLPCTIYRRATSACCTLPYPDLPYPDLTIPDQAYLFCPATPLFVSLSS
jgi:hypothetical protein